MHIDNSQKDFILNKIKQILTEEAIVKANLSSLKNQVLNLESFVLNLREEKLIEEINVKEPEASLIEQKEETKPEMKFNSKNREINTSRTGFNWEINLGIKWLSRVGIIAILIGLTLALSYSFQHFFTKEIKVLTFALLSIITFFVGNKLFNKYKILGRVLQAGGITLGYLTIYASFFFESTQLFYNSDLFGYISLFLYISYILFMAEKMSSSIIGSLAFAFGYFTATFAHYPNWALIPTTMLNLAFLRLVYLNKFSKFLPYISLIGSLIVYFSQNSYHYFLIICFCIFHISNFFRGNSNFYFYIINSFVFYLNSQGLFNLDRGMIELIFTTINLMSFIYYSKFKYDKKLINISLISTLSFLTLGVFSYFKSVSISTLVFANLALLTGILINKSKNSKIYCTFSVIFLILSFVQVFIYICDNSVFNLNSSLISKILSICNIAYICLISLYLQDKIYTALNTFYAFSFINLLICDLILFLGFENIIDAKYKTLIWALCGIIFLVVGFIRKQSKYRYNGLAWFLLASIHLLFVDIRNLLVFHQILAFTAFGICLLLASYFYSKS